MGNMIQSWKLAVVLPVIAIAYASVLFFMTAQPAYSWETYRERTTNSVDWDSQFVDNQSLHGFPSKTRDHIRQGMYQWDDVHTGADFQVDEVQSNSDVYVQSWEWTTPNSPGWVTHSYSNGQIDFTAMSLNRNWDWNDDLCRVSFTDREADVRVVATHEAGHMISHSSTVWYYKDTDPHFVAQAYRIHYGGRRPEMFCAWNKVWRMDSRKYYEWDVGDREWTLVESVGASDYRHTGTPGLAWHDDYDNVFMDHGAYVKQRLRYRLTACNFDIPEPTDWPGRWHPHFLE